MANISRVRSRKRSKGEICRLVAPAVVRLTEPLNLCVRDPIESSTLPLSATMPIVASLSSSAPSSSSEPASLVAGGKLAILQRRRKKRSAIFLPPERLSDNDVCICKFKFVAGVSPRLQEKKVLSVDSGGNFRFFPELQQQQSAKPIASPSQTTGTVAHGSTQLVNVKRIPDLLPIAVPSSSPISNAVAANPSCSSFVTRQHPTAPVNVQSEELASGSSAIPPAASNKRLSRRQKMEQTFGEKGFLIQTQHVPASAGSAFSKFRQLKKFTRFAYMHVY